ncbi:MAG: dephospho-CoA kinase [Eubacteriales bacterium]|nr:dephospho-CoA kinase [Eubacteriales bacterium]
MKTIGITGGVGSGKSMVLDMLSQNYNCDIIKADDVAKGMYNIGSKAYNSILDLFGEDILNEDKSVNKKMLADILFKNDRKRLALNSIIHPMVKQEIIKRVTGNKIENKFDYTFVECALLLEEHYDVFCDETWYITASENIRRERLKLSRNYSDEKIDGIFASQKSDEEFKENVDYVIDNSKDPETTFETVRKLLNN